MKRRFIETALYVRTRRNLCGDDVYLNSLADSYVGYKGFNRDIFIRFIKGECGPNGGKIRKKRNKAMIFDGLDLSEMIEDKDC